MRVTHYGHSCLLLDTGSARLLIDPGTFAAGFEGLTGLDAVLVTHQHPDHLDAERLAPLLRANPDARLVVDRGTATQVDTDHEVAGPGDALEIAGARVEVIGGGDHAVIHGDVPVIPNNAYLVDGTHLHPGDAFPSLPVPVDVLFLPTAAPWQKLADAITYLREVAPRTAVPIHQGILAVPGMYYGHFERLGPEKTTVKVLDSGTPTRL